VNYQDITRSARAKGYVRTLQQQEELPLLRDHLLRLDSETRRDRFHGFLDDSFIERIRRITPRIHSPRSPLASKPASVGWASAASCSKS
jgi:hypothetical protein